MQVEANDEFGWVFQVVLPIAVAIAALGYYLMRTPSPSALYNATVFGCYAAPNSPAILMDAAGMHVRQAGYPVIPFHLERSKSGIVLMADAPIRADKNADGYRFGIDERGIGWIMPFHRVANGRIYGVFDENLLSGFNMLASDGVDLNYAPADVASCA